MDDDAGISGAAPAAAGYDVGRFLGRGGSADVWLVTEQSSGRNYALKCFARGGGAEAAEAEHSARREVRILAALDHDHLVRARMVVRLREGPAGGTDPAAGTSAWDGKIGLIMDYAAGGSLGQLAESRGRLAPGETVTVLTPIAQALAYLHGQGFTHGDVSPGNVLFTAHGKPLLADVGVARMVADAPAVAEAGTEGFRDPAPVDHVRAGLQPERDVYSLAALGWYCLTGSAPEPGAQRPPLPLLVPGVPAELAAVLEAGLQGDRRLRPTAAEFAAAVHRSAPAVPVDLSASVHPTVIPELLTRRTLPLSARARRTEKLRSLTRRLRGPGVRPARKAGPRHAGRLGLALLRPARPYPARPHAGRRPVVVAAAILAMLGVLTAVWALAGSPLPPAIPGFASGDAAAVRQPAADKPTEPAADQAAVPPRLQAQLAAADPVEAVRGLAGLRSLALSSGNFRLLDQVNVPASRAAAADDQIRARLEGAGRVLDGFSTVLAWAERSDDGSGPLAIVAVTAGTSAYQERDRSGVVLAEAEATPEQQMRLVLAPVDGRWRVQDILPGG